MEDSFEIENLLNEWVYRLRRGELSVYVDEHFPVNIEGTDYYFFLRSNPERTALTTYDEIHERVVGMDQDLVPSQPSYHTATTPIIEISEDGTYAKATWMEHSLTNLGQARLPGIPAAEDGKVNYMIFTGKYFHEFKKIDGEWYVTGFNWEPMMSLPTWQFDAVNSKGWASSGSTQKFPLPGEAYQSNLITAVSLSDLTIKNGETAKVKAAFTPATTANTGLTWTSSDPKVATVDADGTVKAMKPGTATITATSKHVDGVKASCTVTVTCEHNQKASITPAMTKADGKISYSCPICENTTAAAKTIYKISSVKLSKTAYDYNGKAKKPTVIVKDRKGNVISAKNYTVTYAKGRANVGTYKVTVKFKGNYAGTVTRSFKVNPKATSIVSATGKSKAFVVKWSKRTKQITGYQIRYASKSNMKNAKKILVTKNTTVSKRISKLKAKKTYYVQVRTYKTVKGSKYYSSWSKTKKVTTKK